MASTSSSSSSVRFVSSESPVVIIAYQDLVDKKDLSASIATAFGNEGLGIIAIEGIPKIQEIRQNILPLAREFSRLPKEVLTKYEHKPSHYNFGWSHGKEIFVGKPDYSKGSFYANPLHDVPYSDEKLWISQPSFAHPNIWPTSEFPQLEPAFKAMGRLITDVGLLLAAECDRFVAAREPSYPPTKLYDIVKDSKTPKGRLLHYFPVENTSTTTETKTDVPMTESDYASWCGWHNDHGSLTGLVPAMYINAEGKQIPNPDPKAGLYIRSRQGKIVKAILPEGTLGFQMGETQQVHSGGHLMATPHCVMGASGKGASAGVSRETYALFMEPEFTDDMKPPASVDFKRTIEGQDVKELPQGVPGLGKRWRQGQTFGTFTTATLEAYDVDAGGGGMGSIVPPTTTTTPTTVPTTA